VHFSQVNLKHANFLVKLHEHYTYNGPRHFDAHALQTSDYDDVRAFAHGCKRTYMILRDKAERWNTDAEIQGLLREINSGDAEFERLTRKYSGAGAKKLLAADLDRVELAK